MVAAKDDRLATIRRLIRSESVGTQGELRRNLRSRGMAVDQSTLSRDLLELGIRKKAGRYVIELPAERQAAPALASTVVSFTTCGPHMIVIRTSTGAAQPLAVQIDQAAEPSIAASLAGDDTIFLATKSRRLQTVALRRLTQWFGDRYER